MRLHNLFLMSLLMAVVMSCSTKVQDRLVILHTNDLHSQIDPDKDGRGGVSRIKVLVDSVRESVEHVMLVDAGDVVQGTLYYHLYKGEVETAVMNQLGYDVAIMGNHEFDNGMKSLAENQYREMKATRLSTNYDLSSTVLDTLFQPYIIKEVAGRRFGIIGLGLNPQGMISPGKCKGVIYKDPIYVADSVANKLKTGRNVDIVIALSHLGYESEDSTLCTDVNLASSSRYIDIVIGGHTHKVIDPLTADSSVFCIKNAIGHDVIVAQAGSRGAYLGEISIDLKTLKVNSRLIAVDGRLDEAIDPGSEAMLSRYRHMVDSLLSIEVVESLEPLPKDGNGVINLVSDFVKDKGENLCGGKVDLALMNRGGIRNDLPCGIISKGELMMAFPFDNHVVVMEIKGQDLLEAFEKIAQRKHIGISHIDFDRVDTDKTYRIATIDYLAEGGDYLDMLTRGHVISVSEQPLVEDLAEYLSDIKARGCNVNPSTEMRNFPIEK